ncbi:MAG: 1,4-dihydroxy-6-naphthoate synthase [Planctomycetota bacterium]|nr:1,4-dihydroxy-6-naphthoate synthase [Planctomycetota bacterium]
MLTLAISPCPNDTFAFHALIERGRYRIVLEDVEELNRRAERGDADVIKVSVAAFPRIRERYALLYSGGAAGYGVGPLVVAREERTVGGRVAIPGERTTAALLLRQLGRFETVAMRFDRIEDAVLSGAVDCGVLIHEGRFTYADRDLVRLADLGEVWEQRTGAPIPLGAIAIRRDLGPDAARAIDAAIRASVDHALSHPEQSAGYVREHAQEMDPAVIRRHIELYVNDYTRDLDAQAVERLLAFGRDEGVFAASALPIFAYPRVTSS